MKLIILSFLLTGSLAAPASQSLIFNDDGSYRFYYETGKDGGSHSREEVRNPDGVVVGKFSYEDPSGEMREIKYRADDSGYVAEGDVSVPDVPKGKFPADVPEEEQSEPSQEIPSPEIDAEKRPTTDFQPEVAPNEIPAADVEEAPPSSEEEDGKDDIKDLALEESTANDPPEAFPEGFFLQHFQGLRRLPEPTTEVKDISTEPPAKDDMEKSDTSEVNNEQPEPTNGEDKSGVGMFAPLRPFPHFPPQEWAAALHHQPVYVFSYQQPDSYGYHYFF